MPLTPAITVWQPWASLIAAGAKPFEFRSWPAQRCYIGTRIAIHAGARVAKRNELLELVTRLQTAICRFQASISAASRRWRAGPTWSSA